MVHCKVGVWDTDQFWVVEPVVVHGFVLSEEVGDMPVIELVSVEVGYGFC